MFSAKRIILASVSALAAMSWPHLAIAEDQLAVVLEAPSTEVESAAATSISLTSELPQGPQSESADTRQNPFGSKPVSALALSSKRGGDRVINDNDLKGVVSNTSATNVSTGMNVISEGSFAGSSGMPMVVQNSGNNVLIQNSTIVNIQMK